MLGVSIYPYKEIEKETFSYLEMAAKYNFQRVFTNLLTMEPGREKSTIEKMTRAIKYARKLDMEVIVDLNPSIFKQLKVDYNDLSFFQHMGATGIRLDTAFDGMIESLMTYDDTGLDLEINISLDTFYLENMMAYQPNIKRIMGCHNFYPQAFTGLDYDYFIKCSKRYKKLGIRTAAFVNSQDADHGPHEYTSGLCTLEMHRCLSIDTQAKHLFAIGLIDDIIIANAYASEAELKVLSELRTDPIELEVEFLENATTLEKEIVLENQHFNRGDINSYSIRSTLVKLNYKTKDLPKNNTRENLMYGDITIGNNSFGQYKAELNIVKLPMPNIEQEKNVVAKIVEHNQFLISYIQPWTKFCFKEVRQNV